MELDIDWLAARLKLTEGERARYYSELIDAAEMVARLMYRKHNERIARQVAACWLAGKLGKVGLC